MTVRRRDFISLLGGAAAWPAAARAQQQGGGLPRLVYITGGTSEDRGARFAAFRAAFEKLGWADGRNVRIDLSWDSAPAGRERSVAAEVVRSAPAVILITGTPMANALRLETSTIPIIFAALSDPVASGLVDGMVHPGGNLTGFVNYLFSIGGKWLEMLKEAAPGTRRVLVVLAPGNRAQEGFLRVIESAGATLRVAPVAAMARDAAEIERAVEAFARGPDGGLLVLPGAPGLGNAELIIELTARHRLPAI